MIPQRPGRCLDDCQHLAILPIGIEKPRPLPDERGSVLRAVSKCSKPAWIDLNRSSLGSTGRSRPANSRYKCSCALISDAVVADAISNSLIQCTHCVGHRLNDLSIVIAA